VEPTPLSSPPSHNKLIIGIVAVFVLVVAGIAGAYFLLQPTAQPVDDFLPPTLGDTESFVPTVEVEPDSREKSVELERLLEVEKSQGEEHVLHLLNGVTVVVNLDTGQVTDAAITEDNIDYIGQYESYADFVISLDGHIWVEVQDPEIDPFPNVQMVSLDTPYDDIDLQYAESVQLLDKGENVIDSFIPIKRGVPFIVKDAEGNYYKFVVTRYKRASSGSLDSEMDLKFQKL